MLTLQECIDFSDADTDEVQVIAEHEHVPQIVAAEIAATLMRTPKGRYTLRRYIQENLERAAAAGHLQRERYLRRVLDEFNRKHPGLRVV